MDPATPVQPYTPPPIGNNGGNPAPPYQGGPAPAAPYQPPVGPSQYSYPSTANVPPAGQPPIGAGQPYPPSNYPPREPANFGPSVDSDAPVVGPSRAQYMQSAPPAGAGQPQTPQTNLKQELIERLRTANNVLVTVSNNPSVDQLSAAIGLTLVLNKLDKHATAVYSGNTPSAIEFLEPKKTLEKNTDSLRDFIIALDKAKADKLRYKVEDKFVKIFITPYHTSLSENDLEFSQGDFNVDVVVAIGVHKREELDEAITAHGRILHDAVTASVNNKQTSDLGTINWFEADSSSLCEMVVSLIEPLQGDKALLDQQIATAFLTGVVAETDRFSNEKTSPHTMNIAATLMKAGANQQLVSSKLEAPEPVPKKDDFDGKKMDELAAGAAAPVPTPSKDGSLEISHRKDETPAPKTKTLQELENENRGGKEEGDEEDSDLAKIHIDEQGKLMAAEQKDAEKPSGPIAEQAPAAPSNMILEPPTLGGDLSSVTKPEHDTDSAPAVDSPATDHSQLQHAKTITPLSDAEKGQTLAQIEETVASPHLSDADSPMDLPATMPSGTGDMENAARQAVTAANNAAAPTTNEEVFPPQLVGPDQGLPPDPTAGAIDPASPPPVPPPMVPHY